MHTERAIGKAVGKILPFVCYIEEASSLSWPRYFSMSSSGDKSSPASDEFSIAPAEGLSENERMFRSRFYPPVDEPVPTAAPWQFSIRDMMVITFFVAVGLGGGTMVPADMFAGFIGLLLAGGLIFRLFIPIENRWLDWLFCGVAVVYGCALLRVIVMGGSELR
jgi:hypothetical protein